MGFSQSDFTDTEVLFEIDGYHGEEEEKKVGIVLQCFLYDAFILWSNIFSLIFQNCLLDRTQCYE